MLRSIAERKECTVAQVCMSWILSKGFALVTKTQNEERMRENLKSREITLEEEDVQKIEELTKYNQRLFFDSNEVL